MTERGILMTPENYGKTEAGTKWMTRRIIKPQPRKQLIHHGEGIWKPGRWTLTKTKCPFGTIGDRLYVKEGLERHDIGVWYRRDHQVACLGIHLWKWQRNTLSAMFMPKWAARLWLQLTDVRVERLQDISEQDARAEGCRVPEIIYPDSPKEAYSYVEQFKLLWESNTIHKPGSWDLNPWVWCLSFRRIKP